MLAARALHAGAFHFAVKMQYDLSMPRYTIDFDKDFDKTLSDLVETTDATTKRTSFAGQWPATAT